MQRAWLGRGNRPATRADLSRRSSRPHPRANVPPACVCDIGKGRAKPRAMEAGRDDGARPARARDDGARPPGSGSGLECHARLSRQACASSSVVVAGPTQVDLTHGANNEPGHAIDGLPGRPWHVGSPPPGCSRAGRSAPGRVTTAQPPRAWPGAARSRAQARWSSSTGSLACSPGNEALACEATVGRHARHPARWHRYRRGWRCGPGRDERPSSGRILTRQVRDEGSGPGRRGRARPIPPSAARMGGP